MADNTTYYVAKSGNDSNAGTEGAPFLTIEKGCDTADNGTGNIVQIIDSGEYAEGDIEIFTRAITVRATGSDYPVMNGDGLSGDDGDWAFKPYVSGCLFEGFTMKNYDNYAIDDGSNGNYIISGCFIYGIAGSQPLGTGGGSAEMHETVIVADTLGAVIVGNSSTWINNSLLVSNAKGRSVIYGNSYTNVTCSFCTVISNGYTTAVGTRYYNAISQVARVVNCLVSGTGNGINGDNSTYNFVNVKGDPFITYNASDYGGSARSAATGEQSAADGNVTKFNTNVVWAPDGAGTVDFGTIDFSLQSTATAVDAGVAYGPGATNITWDISGSLRGSPPDIGAYNYVDSAATWTDYETEPSLDKQGDFTLNTYINLPATHRYRALNDPHQPPFFFGIRGPAAMRGRPKTKPYKPEDK